MMPLMPAPVRAARDAGPILVVDDDPKIVALVRTYLERERYPVVTAMDGRAALEVQKQSQKRVAVLPAAQADHHPIAVLDHVEIVDSGPHSTKKSLLETLGCVLRVL